MNRTHFRLFAEMQFEGIHADVQQCGVVIELPCAVIAGELALAAVCFGNHLYALAQVLLAAVHGRTDHRTGLHGVAFQTDESNGHGCLYDARKRYAHVVNAGRNHEEILHQVHLTLIRNDFGFHLADSLHGDFQARIRDFVL